MSSSKFDTTFILACKAAGRLQLPIEYTYTGSHGVLRSVIDLVVGMMEKQYKLYDIYVALITFEVKLTPNDISLLYANRAKLMGYTDEQIIPVVNDFYLALQKLEDNPEHEREEILHAKLIPKPFKSVDDFVSRHQNWVFRFEASQRHAKRILDKIQMSEERLSAITPVAYHNLQILMTTSMFKPSWADGTQIEVSDGIEIFNRAVPSFDVPLIQYNDEEGKTLHRIYHGSEKDKDVPPFWSFIHPTVWTISGRPDTIYLTVLGEPPGVEPTKDSYLKCIFSLADGTLRIPSLIATPSTNVAKKGNTRARVADEMLQKVRKALPVVKLDVGKEIRLRATFEVEDVEISEPVLHWMILNEPIFGMYLYIEESSHARAEKYRLNIHYRTTVEDPSPEEISSTGYISNMSSVSFTFGALESEEIDEITPLSNLDIASTEELLPPSSPKNLKINVIRAGSREILDQFIVVFTHLLKYYMEGKNRIEQYFRAMIPGSCPLKKGDAAQLENPDEEEENEDEVESKDSGVKPIFNSKIKNLKTLAREIFVNGYARKCQCPLQPILIKSDEVEAWQGKKFIDDGGVPKSRQIMPFPPPREGDDIPSYHVVCPDDENPYPTLKENRNLPNAREYPYLPCCAKTDELTNPGSGFYNYWAAKENPDFLGKPKKGTKVNYRLSTFKILETGRTGDVPKLLEDLFQSGIEEEENIEIKQDFTRIGVPPSTASLIHCVSLARQDDAYLNLNTNEERERYVQIRREQLAAVVSPLLFKQELYDLSPEEIQSRLRDHSVFLDPYLFYRGVEEFFGVNIFVFNPKGPLHPISGISDVLMEVPVMEVPRCKITHIRIPRHERPTIIILKHWGAEANPLGYPQCELIVSRGEIVTKIPRKNSEEEEEEVEDFPVTSPVLIMQTMAAGYGIAPGVNIHPTYIFGAEMSERLHGILNGSLHSYVWSFPPQNEVSSLRNPESSSLAPRVAEPLIPNLPEVRDDPYSRVDWREIFEVGATVVSQQVDSYGKLRILGLVPEGEANVITVCVPPSQPLNLPSLNSITVTPEFQVRQFLGDPSGVTQKGLWYSAIDYRWAVFVPAIVSGLPTDNAPPPPIGIYHSGEELKGSTMSSTSLTQQEDFRDLISETRIVRRYTSILMQLINWLWRQERTGISEWWKQHVICDTLLPRDKPVLPVAISRRLPPTSSTVDALKAIGKWWPAYIREDGIHLYPALYDKAFQYFTRRAQLTQGLPPTDELVVPPTRITGLFVWDTDFIQVPKSVIFTNPVHAASWFTHQVHRGTGILGNIQTINPIVEKLDVDIEASFEPFIFRDLQTGKIYLIQNVRGGELLRAVNVCLIWKERGVNTGNKTEASTVQLQDIPHVIYGISTSQVLAVIVDNSKLRTDYIQILQYIKKRYAAMLPIL